jgi:hypothetical protein
LEALAYEIDRRASTFAGQGFQALADPILTEEG